MSYPFYIADVFTGAPFGGNQLAVLPDARGLSGARMQQVAREFNFSETTFVLPPDDPAHTRRLRIFTPGAEVPFAGHPTVGTAYVLASLGEIPLAGPATEVVFEEGVGPVRVTVRAAGGQPESAQLWAARMPEIGPQPPAAAELAAVLSLDPGDLSAAPFAPRAASCGIPFLCVPLADRAALGRARLDLARWRDRLADSWAAQLYLFTADAASPGVDFQARMFAPGLGVPEDPATGSAATVLAGLLGLAEPEDGTFHWTVEQGVEMGRPSRLELEAERRGGALTAIRVGGAAVLVAQGTIEVPGGA